MTGEGRFFGGAGKVPVQSRGGLATPPSGGPFPADGAPAGSREGSQRAPMIDWESFYNAFRRPGFIPGYEIQNHLGGGAFGEVYKARKTSIGKSYAIKFLRLDDAAQKDAVDRELEQVRFFAAIDHPNLVTIEDMGVVLGVPYLIMGYAGEDTLARRLKRRDLDRGNALRYFVQACRGVLALHDRRLAHFDLKPSNVFLNGDVARVGDYGLAKLLTEGRQTLSFGRGTPHYMAPEMLKNRADHRADIYSLGVILYESLAFALPFGGDASGGFVLREEDRSPEFPPDFPAALRPAVERCLRLEPEHRFASVHELLDGLGQTARQGDSVRMPWDASGPPPPPPAAPRAESPTPRSPREELTAAAAEFARGAALVARSVWDGVVERVSSSREAAQPERSPAPAPPGPDPVAVSTVSTLEDPDEASLGADRPSPFADPDSPWRVELRRMRQASESGPGGPVPAAAATVPVPPRAAGGFLGNVVQSVVVGAEILGALVTGPVMVVARGAASFFDRIVRGVPAVLGAGIRLVLFLLLMGLIGGLVTSVVLAALALNP